MVRIHRISPEYQHTLSLSCYQNKGTTFEFASEVKTLQRQRVSYEKYVRPIFACDHNVYLTEKNTLFMAGTQQIISVWSCKESQITAAQRDWLLCKQGVCGAEGWTDIFCSQTQQWGPSHIWELRCPCHLFRHLRKGHRENLRQFQGS